MTNEAIIEAALKIWAKDFYKTTSLQSLAGALGVTKPALYRHFRSKDALLAAMRQSYYDRLALLNSLADYTKSKTSERTNNSEQQIQISLIVAEFF